MMIRKAALGKHHRLLPHPLRDGNGDNLAERAKEKNHSLRVAPGVFGTGTQLDFSVIR